MKTCRHCRFAKAIGTGKRLTEGPDSPDVDVGTCHRNPPAVGPLAWPLVGLDEDWCGERKQRRWWHK